MPIQNNTLIDLFGIDHIPSHHPALPVEIVNYFRRELSFSNRDQILNIGFFENQLKSIFSNLDNNFKSINHIPQLQEESLDFILCAFGFEHLLNTELKKAIKPNGLLVIATNETDPNCKISPWIRKIQPKNKRSELQNYIDTIFDPFPFQEIRFPAFNLESIESIINQALEFDSHQNLRKLEELLDQESFYGKVKTMEIFTLFVGKMV